jgi:hypothetical protein
VQHGSAAARVGRDPATAAAADTLLRARRADVGGHGGAWWKSFDATDAAAALPSRCTRDDWQAVAAGYHFVPSLDDVNHKLRLDVTFTDAQEAPVTETAVTRWVLPRPPPPPPRRFLMVRDG